MAGVLGGNLAIAPIVEAGDTVIRVRENLNESVNFPQAEGIVETITESVTVQVT